MATLDISSSYGASLSILNVDRLGFPGGPGRLPRDFGFASPSAASSGAESENPLIVILGDGTHWINNSMSL